MRVVKIPVQGQRHQRQTKKRWWPYLLLTLLVLAGLIVYNRPLPNAAISLNLPAVPVGHPSDLAFPGYGQASFAATGYGLLESSGAQQPIATASIAKVITALCVLEKHPLKASEQGPLLTLTDADAELYRAQIQNNGSRLYVEPGEQISERQALEALLLPSANNMADSLAIWAFGSLPAYQKYAASYAAEHGLGQTHIGSDASGFDPSTVSSANDLAILGLIAIKQPVLMAIAGEQSAELPLVGIVTNYDTLLGDGMVTGIKTGNNDQNPGAFLYAAPLTVGTTQLQITGAIMQAPDLATALNDTKTLVESASHAFETISYVHRGQVVGQVRTAWGTRAAVVATQDVRIVRFNSQPLTVDDTLHPTTGVQAGDVGAFALRAGQVQSSSPLRVAIPALGPSVWWRLSHLR